MIFPPARHPQWVSASFGVVSRLDLELARCYASLPGLNGQAERRREIPWQNWGGPHLSGGAKGPLGWLETIYPIWYEPHLSLYIILYHSASLYHSVYMYVCQLYQCIFLYLSLSLFIAIHPSLSQTASNGQLPNKSSQLTDRPTAGRQDFVTELKKQLWDQHRKGVPHVRHNALWWRGRDLGPEFRGHLKRANMVKQNSCETVGHSMIRPAVPYFFEEIQLYLRQWWFGFLTPNKKPPQIGQPSQPSNPPRLWLLLRIGAVGTCWLWDIEGFFCSLVTSWNLKGLGSRGWPRPLAAQTYSS